MKSIVFITGLLVAATATFAQSIADLPSCAGPCATNALGATSCGGTDIGCICKDSKFIDTVGSCTLKACTDPSDIQKALTAAQDICKSAGVTIPAAEISSITAMATSSATSSGSSGASQTSSAASPNSTGTGNGTTSTNGTSSTSPSPSAQSSPAATGAASQTFALSSVAIAAALVAFLI